ncbi:MAG: anti-sigma factor [Flavobacteriaceae bacterium]|jgi:anti-sigma-K factor RskA|nr:anti-sigma factor [Flavobacteriaceae bacterium]MCI5089079.1 anti-sigma factor [Flavobacteriaceae bacterium]CAI8228274.1 MAG: Uncharacterised protein [SAR116 cluster bacterium]
MKANTKQIIESGDLEAYLLGDLTEQEGEKIRKYILMYPEVKEAYDLLERQLETFTEAYKKTPPKDLQSRIENQIQRIQQFTRFSWMALGLSLLVFLGSAYYVIQENNKLSIKQGMIDHQIENLQLSFDHQLDEIRNQFILRNSPQTRTVTLQHQMEDQSFTLHAYLNKKERMSYIEILSLPVLPPGKCYQLWTERNGSKESVGILPDRLEERLFVSIPFKEKATAYITIEDKPGNLNPKASLALFKIPIE